MNTTKLGVHQHRKKSLPILSLTLATLFAALSASAADIQALNRKYQRIHSEIEKSRAKAVSAVDGIGNPTNSPEIAERKRKLKETLNKRYDELIKIYVKEYYREIGTPAPKPSAGNSEKRVTAKTGTSGTSVSKTVRAKVGGVVEIDRLKLDFPANALKSDATVRISKIKDAALAARINPARKRMAPLFKVELSGKLSAPVELTYPYAGPMDKNGNPPSFAYVSDPREVRYDGAYLPLTPIDTTYDKTRGLLTAKAPHFSIITCIFGPWDSEYEKVSDINFTVFYMPDKTTKNYAMRVLRQLDAARSFIRDNFGLTPPPYVLKVYVLESLDEKGELDGALDPSPRGYIYSKLRIKAGLASDDLKVVVFHEYFHHVQDFYQPGLSGLKNRMHTYTWIDEACSITLERLIRPLVKPNVINDGAFFKHSMTAGFGGYSSIFSSSGHFKAEQYGYAASYFIYWLATSYLRDTKVIGDIFKLMKARRARLSAEMIPACIDAAIKKRRPSASLDQAWKMFLDYYVRKSLNGTSNLFPAFRAVASKVSPVLKHPDQKFSIQAALGPVSGDVKCVMFDNKTARLGQLKVSCDLRTSRTVAYVYLTGKRNKLMGAAKLTSDNPTATLDLASVSKGYLTVCLASGYGASGVEKHAVLLSCPSGDVRKPSALLPAPSDIPPLAGVKHGKLYADVWRMHYQRANDYVVDVKEGGFKQCSAKVEMTHQPDYSKARNAKERALVKTLPTYPLTVSVTTVTNMKAFLAHIENLKKKDPGWRSYMPKTKIPFRLGDAGGYSERGGMIRAWFRTGNCVVNLSAPKASKFHLFNTAKLVHKKINGQ